MTTKSSHSEVDISAYIIRFNPWILNKCKPYLIEAALNDQSSSKYLVLSFSPSAQNTISQRSTMFYLRTSPHNTKQWKNSFQNETCSTCYVSKSHSNNAQSETILAFKLFHDSRESSHVYRKYLTVKENFLRVICRGNRSAVAISCPIREKVLQQKRLTNILKKFRR